MNGGCWIWETYGEISHSKHCHTISEKKSGLSKKMWLLHHNNARLEWKLLLNCYLILLLSRSGTKQFPFVLKAERGPQRSPLFFRQWTSCFHNDHISEKPKGRLLPVIQQVGGTLEGMCTYDSKIKKVLLERNDNE